MKYTDLFIDFDDTLYDTHGNANIALGELFDLYHWERYFSSLQAFIEPYWRENIALWAQYAKGEITRDYLIIERFRRPLSIAQGINVTEEFCLEVSDCFLNLCADKPGTLPDAHLLMQYLKNKGYGLHLCSNGFHEVQYRKLKASDMLQYFDSVILSEDAGVNKPSPQFFEYALLQSGARRERTLMIGDNIDTDIRGAHDFGIDTLYFNPHHETVAHPEAVTYEVQALREIIHIL